MQRRFEIGSHTRPLLLDFERSFNTTVGRVRPGRSVLSAQARAQRGGLRVPQPGARSNLRLSRTRGGALRGAGRGGERTPRSAPNEGAARWARASRASGAHIRSDQTWEQVHVGSTQSRNGAETEKPAIFRGLRQTGKLSNQHRTRQTSMARGRKTTLGRRLRTRPMVRTRS